ncbi:MAG: D-alanine--D-alanine ligase [Pseudohongiellaceae bacterium]
MKPINREQLISAAGHVAVLKGGTSAEREISLQSGQAVFDSLKRQGVNATVIDTGADIVARLAEVQPDLVVNMLHGPGGEDGLIQGVLEMLGITYAGSGVLASALAMDKARSKLIWQRLNLPTPNFEVLDAKSDWQAIIKRHGAVVVKPVRGGSSIGIAIARDATALQQQFQQAQQYDSEVMAEQYIGDGEFTVGMLDEDLLPPIRLTTTREFYDYEAKYEDPGTRFICPADISQERLDALNTLALEAYRSLGCRGLARVDVMQDKDGGFYLLEVNTIPGLTSHSLVPAAAKQAGIDFDELTLRLLNGALGKHG